MSNKSKFVKSAKLAIAGVALTAGLSACSMFGGKHDCKKHDCSKKEKSSCSAKHSCSKKKHSCSKNSCAKK